MPYDDRDRSFLERKLEELKMSAAQYQTHSLTIANKYYDKDLASEEKLRQLVDFCEAYALSSRAADSLDGSAVLARKEEEEKKEVATEEQKQAPDRGHVELFGKDEIAAPKKRKARELEQLPISDIDSEAIATAREGL